MKRLFLLLLIASLIVGAMLLASCEVDPGQDDVHEHEFKSTVVEPTCLKGGYTEHKCGCGYDKRDTFTNPTNAKHDFKQVGASVKPTCTEDGYDLYVCSNCGEEEHRKPVSAAHTWGEWVVTEVPNCMDMGMRRHDCDFCDAYEEEELPSDHRYGEPVSTPADCDDPEILTYTCTTEGCGFVKEEIGARALGHVFGEWYIYKDSTCDTLGEMRRDCMRCDGKVNDCEIEDCDHSECGTIICEIDGCDHSTCGNDVCTHYESKEIPRHHYTVPIKVEPTCDTYGYEGYKCENCDKVDVHELIDPLGHNFNEWHAVEGKPQLEQRECETCGEVESKTKQ